MESSNLRTGSMTETITGRFTMLIEPYTHEEVIRTLETTYKGVLVVPLETYRRSKLDLPLLASFDTIRQLSTEQTVLCLIPKTSEDPIQLLYESYTSSKRRINVYDCQYKIFNCIGAASSASASASSDPPS